MNLRTFLTVLMVLAFPIMAVADDSELKRISCPLSWPGPDGKVQPLGWTQAWFDVDAMFGEDDEKISPPYDASTLLDCAYGYPSKHSSVNDGDISTLRLTIEVPSHVKCCKGWVGPIKKGVWRGRQMTCLTQPDPGQTPAEARIIQAEPVSGSTTLLGLGLNQSREQLEGLASAQGFACSQDNRAGMVCVRNEDRMTIRFMNGRSVEVEQTAPWTKDQTNELKQKTILRFGLHRLYVDEGEKYSTQVWRIPHSPFRIAMVVTDDIIRVRLTDLSKVRVPSD